MTTPQTFERLAALLRDGRLIPYTGAGMLELCDDVRVPVTPKALAAALTSRASVPHKIRDRLTQAAQFIENFKHRKTLVKLMDEAFATPVAPSTLHLALARSASPLLVETWYDGALAAALAATRGAQEWGFIQGQSQSEHFGQWTATFGADGAVVAQPDAAWRTLLYQPLGARLPGSNYLVSDSDFVEVLTEIDIQTPIPRAVQELRGTRGFLFVGCRFDDQLARAFARQIMKRSAGPHWAVLPHPPTRMEQRFLDEQGITRIAMPLPEFAATLLAQLDAATPLAA